MLKIKTSVIWIFASQVVLLFTGFILLKFLTVNMSVEDFGYYSLCMSLVLFARQVVYDPVSITAAKVAGSALHDGTRFSSDVQVVKSLTDKLGILLLLLGAAIGVFASFITNTNGLFAIVLMCAFYLCANAAQGLYVNVLNSVGERKCAAIYSIADSIFKVSVLGVFVAMFAASLEFVLACIAGSAAFVFICMRLYINLRFVRSRVDPIHLRALTKRMIVLSLPFYVPTALASLKSVSDKWILTTFTGVDDLAGYSVLFQLGYSPILLLIGVAQTYLAPKIYQLSANNTAQSIQELKSLITKILLSILALSLIATCVAFLASDRLLSLFTGAKYQDLGNLVPIFVLSGAIAGLAGVLQVIAIGVLKAESVGRLMNLSVLLCLTVFLTFVACFGFYGAAVALLLTSIVSALLYWVVLYRRLYKYA